MPGKNFLIALLLVTTAGCGSVEEERWDSLCGQMGWSDCRLGKGGEDWKILGDQFVSNYKTDERVRRLTKVFDEGVSNLIDEKALRMFNEMKAEKKLNQSPYHYQEGPFLRKRVEGEFALYDATLLGLRCVSRLEQCDKFVRVRMPTILGPEIEVEVDDSTESGRRLLLAHKKRKDIMCGVTLSGTQQVLRTGDGEFSGWWRVTHFTVNRCSTEKVAQLVTWETVNNIYSIIKRQGFTNNIPEDWRSYSENTVTQSIQNLQDQTSD